MSDRPASSTLSKTTHVPASEQASAASLPEVPVLVVAWSAEPDRVGEIVVLPPSGRPTVLGRGPGEGPEARVQLLRQRPGALEPRPPLASPGISRRQLLLHPRRGGVELERVGRSLLEVNGVRCDRADVEPGDVVVLRRELVLYCTRRPAALPAPRLFPADQAGAFGEADAFGLIGESSAAWRLREAIAFAAKSETHVLVFGQSGTGKELAARAIHALSSRAGGRLLARNAATFPPSLVDAELFGNARNYPNPGMPERAGLIGEADGGTLFLDEIGELPSELQAHLLRVLDADGEYQRLGEAAVRRSSLRLVAATNRDRGALKHDFAARFAASVEVPSLSERREDIPLLARALLLRAAERSPEIAGRFVHRPGGRLRVRVHADLVAHLLGRDYPANVRDLDALLWKALAESHGDVVELPRGALRAGDSAPPAPGSASREEVRAVAERLAERLVLPPRPDPTADEIHAALAAASGSVARAARALGLSSRYALYRLMKKHGIAGEDG